MSLINIWLLVFIMTLPLPGKAALPQQQTIITGKLKLFASSRLEAHDISVSEGRSGFQLVIGLGGNADSISNISDGMHDRPRLPRDLLPTQPAKVQRSVPLSDPDDKHK